MLRTQQQWLFNCIHLPRYDQIKAMVGHPLQPPYLLTYTLDRTESTIYLHTFLLLYFCSRTTSHSEHYLTQHLWPPQIPQHPATANKPPKGTTNTSTRLAVAEARAASRNLNQNTSPITIFQTLANFRIDSEKRSAREHGLLCRQQ